MKQVLRRRAFPDIDEALHCVAVKANDELKQLYSKDDLTDREIETMSKLTNILVFVRKQLPTPDTDKQSSTTITDLDEEWLAC